MDQVVSVLGDLRFLCIRIFLYQEIISFPQKQIENLRFTCSSYYFAIK